MVHAVVSHCDCEDCRKSIECAKQASNICQIVQHAKCSASDFYLMFTGRKYDRSDDLILIVIIVGRWHHTTLFQ